MITYQDVLDAQKRISPYIVHTPLHRAGALDKKLGCKVYLKAENFQVTGSFKIRGAINCILTLSEDQRKRGITATSTGNHAQGVACAAKLLGIDAVIVMPETCNPVKHANTNTEVEFHGSNDINVVILAYRDGCHEDLDCRLVAPFT